MDFLEEFKKGIEEIAHSNDLEKENKELKQKLADKEDLLKKYTQLNEDLTKRLDDRCDICIEKHKQSQNQTAIEELERILAKLSNIENTLINCGNGKEDAICWFVNIIDQQIKSLKGEK